MTRPFSSALLTLILLAGMPGLSLAGPPPEGRPKVGLVLSGGGARGAAHVGVLRVLEELGVPVDVVAGTSMGAVVGGFYASGLSPDELEAVLREADWADTFGDRPRRQDRSFRRKRDDDNFFIKESLGFNRWRLQLPTGLRQGQQLSLLLHRLALPVAGAKSFDDLPIPFRAVASDIVTGESVVLGSGDLAQALQASMSVPGYFAPIERDGRLLVDGGVTNNLPIDVAREMGAEVLIVVDIASPLATREEIHSVTTILGQLTSLLSLEHTKRQLATLGPHDVLLTPDLGDIRAASFDRLLDAVAIGEATARESADALRQVATGPGSPDEPIVRQPKRPPTPVIDFVRWDSDSKLGEAVLEARLKMELGKPLDIHELEKRLRRIHGLGLFSSVTYSLTEQGDQTGLTIRVRRKGWGPGYLQFGFSLSGDFDGSTNFNAGAAYTLTELNKLGGEWRSDIRLGEEPLFTTELHQPLTPRSLLFFNPSLTYRKRNIGLFEDEVRFAEYRASDFTIGLEAGSELGNWGEFRVGVRRRFGSTTLLIGDPDLPEEDFNTGDVFARFSIDELDSAAFPTRGLQLKTEWRLSREGLGADSAFDQVEAHWTGVVSRGRTTLLASLRAGTTSNGNAPLQDRFRLGGLFKMSGFNTNELSGEHAALSRLAVYRRLGQSRFIPVHVGFSLEYGRTWEHSTDMFNDMILSGAVFVGLNSPIVPLYFGFGMAEGGHTAAHVFMGRTF